MRLLQTTTFNKGSSLVFEEFEEVNIPRYAILSHTWDEEEILFTHVVNNTAGCRKGCFKVAQALDQAREDGIDYLWVDSCCIDKNSSTELSEAINSMYRWYESAAICYAYLADVSRDSSIGNERSEFGRSRWFARGWCLQELLAPTDLIFFSKEWTSLGYRREVLGKLALITGIDVDILNKDRHLHTVSIATRMSWASHRVTTRPEDIAYCLMGIFSVNMPLLYGEGPKAFQRLQEEIMKRSSDHSLFAWKKQKSFNQREPHGLLADSPADFALSSDIVPYTEWEDREPHTMTNRGLQINIPLIRSRNHYLAVLDCPVPLNGYTGFICVILQQLSGSSQQYVRVNCARFESVFDRGKSTATVFIQQDIDIRSVTYQEPTHFLELWLNPVSLNGYHRIDLWTSPVWKINVKPSRMEHVLERSNSIWTHNSFMDRKMACAIHLCRRAHDGNCDGFVIALGPMIDFKLGACVYPCSSGYNLSPSEFWSNPSVIVGKTQKVLKQQCLFLSTKRRLCKGALVQRVDVSIENEQQSNPDKMTQEYKDDVIVCTISSQVDLLQAGQCTIENVEAGSVYEHLLRVRRYD